MISVHPKGRALCARQDRTGGCWQQQTDPRSRTAFAIGLVRANWNRDSDSEEPICSAARTGTVGSIPVSVMFGERNLFGRTKLSSFPVLLLAKMQKFRGCILIESQQRVISSMNAVKGRMFTRFTVAWI